MAKKQKKYLIRLAVQIFFLALRILISFNHFRNEQGLAPLLIGSPSLHAVCPFGGVVTIYTYFSEGAFVQNIQQSSVTLMWLVLGLTLLFGPVFCGWICPFGTVEEFVGKIGRKIFKKRYNKFIPFKLDKLLKYLRYVVLLLVVILTATSGKLLFSNIDPYFALFNIWRYLRKVCIYSVKTIFMLNNNNIIQYSCFISIYYFAVKHCFNFCIFCLRLK